ncbi:hypothetical protein N9949_03445 [Akkermansiaceae bacterium]|nr:hypothetical protein [Akkermansiaceae bacterium]
MSAMLCDAWVYLCWLEEGGKQSEAVAYRKLISAIVQIPDLWNQSHIFWLYHYHQVESNFYEVMPTMWDFTFEGERRKKIWRWKKQFDANGEKGEDYKRADDSWSFLSRVFHENGKEKKAHLKKGLEFINYAAIHGDSLFFETLGKALSTSRDDGEKLPFDDFRESVLKLRGKVPSSRAYARRLWISRGLFLLPKAQLADSPFSMSDGAINALTQPRYKKDGSGENKNAEGLLRSPAPWFEVSRQSEEDATKTVLPLTEEGKKHLPEYAEEGFPWSVMSSDLI